MWIVRQIVQFSPLNPGIVQEFVVPVVHRHIVVGLVLVERVGENLVFAPGSDIKAVDVGRGLESGEAHDGGQDVYIAHRFVPGRRQPRFGGTQNEGDVDQGFGTDILFFHDGVVTEEISVVAGEHDHRLVEHSLLLQRRHDLSHCPVNALDHGVGVAANVLSVFVRKMIHMFEVVHVRLFAALGIDRRQDVPVCIAVGKVVRRRNRMVRIRKSDERKKRTRFLGIHIRREAVCQPAGVM